MQISQTWTYQRYTLAILANDFNTASLISDADPYYALINITSEQIHKMQETHKTIGARTQNSKRNFLVSDLAYFLS